MYSCDVLTKDQGRRTKVRLRPSSVVELVRSAAGKQRGDGLEQNLQIEPDRVVANVVHIETHTLLVGEIAAPADLPEAGESRLDGRQIVLPLAELGQLGHGDHTRADQAHLAAQHIE